MHRLLLALALILCSSTGLQAQSLPDRLSQLLIFSEGGEALFLGGTGAAQGGLQLIEKAGAHGVAAVTTS